MTREEIFEYAAENYSTTPEYLWENDPVSAVLRNKTSSKWYAILMRVPRRTLGLPGKGEADVMNIKCGPLVSGSLRMQKGFLPAYHMNKDNWISILIDEAPEEQITELIDLSYELTSGKIRKRKEE